MKTRILIIFLFALTVSITAQNLPIDNVISGSGHVDAENEGTNIEIKGSVFLTGKQFKPIIVKTINGKIGKYNSATFNVKTSRFVVKKDDGNLVAIDNSLISEILFLGYSFKKINGNYLAMLSEGEYQLMKQYKLDIVKGAKDPLSGEQVMPDKYVIKEIYLAHKKENEPKKIRLKKKNILKIFDKSMEVSIKKYVKSNNLSYKNEKDVQSLFNNVNQQ